MASSEAVAVSKEQCICSIAVTNLVKLPGVQDSMTWLLSDVYTS